MQTVSQAYLDGMAAQFRNSCAAELTIYNIDSTMQAAMTCTGFNAISVCDPSKVIDVKNTDYRKLATFERDYMLATGDYFIADSSNKINYFVSNYVSAASPNGNGEYPVTSSGINIAFDEYAEWSTPPRISILTDGNVRKIELTVEYSGGGIWYEEYVVDGNTLVLDDVPAATYYLNMTVRITALSRPECRPRILRLYCGTVESYDSRDVLGMSCTDINDWLCLELPQKTLTTTLVNRYGLTALLDSESPRYTRYQTQATGRIGYDITGLGDFEYVPVGRWYLDGYTVTEHEVRLTWASPLAVINQGQHLWARPTPQSLHLLLGDVMIAPSGLETPFGNMKSLPEQYNMTLDRSNMAGLTLSISSPCPIVTPAVALQLYANVASNKLMIQRTGAYDFHIVNRAIAVDPAMTLLKYECFGDDTFETGEAPGTLAVDTLDAASVTSQKELANDVYIGHYHEPYISPDLLVSVAITGGYGYDAKLYAFCLFVNDGGVGDFNGTITATVRELVKQSAEYQFSNKSGSATLSNPLISRNLSYTYAQQHYDILKHNVFLTRRHRGYPCIDAGDTIAVDVDGEDMNALVVENHWTLSEGSLSGSTKARLVYGGG